MTDLSEPITETTKHRGCWRFAYAGLGLFLALLLIASLLLHKRSQITISPETTYFTDPLDADGMVDYRAALNERFGDVPLKENAAVVLLKLESPGYVPANFHERARVALAMKELPGPRAGCVFLHDLERDEAQRLAPDDPQQMRTALDERHTNTRSRPWTPKEYPLVAKWLEQNSEGMTVAEEALAYDQCFVPLVELHETPTPLFDDQFEFQVVLREIVRSLTARAMLQLGDEQFDEAFSSLRTATHLAQLIEQSPLSLPRSIGAGAEQIPIRGHVHLATSTSLSPQWYRDRIEQLQPLEQRVSREDVLGVGMRCEDLDMMLSLAAGRGSAATEGGPFVRFATSWNDATAHTNRWHDRLSRAYASPSYRQRCAEAAKLEQELHESLTSGKHTSTALSGDYFGEMMLAMKMPLFRRLDSAHALLELLRRMVPTVYALAAYRAEHGEYPESLDALTPDLLDAVPIDPFDDQPLRYRKTENGYVLYSVGANMTDDGDGLAMETRLDQQPFPKPTVPPSNDDIGIVVEHAVEH